MKTVKNNTHVGVKALNSPIHPGNTGGLGARALVGYRTTHYCTKHEREYEFFCDICWPKMKELIAQSFWTKSGVPWPVYEVNEDAVWCHWMGGNVSGFGDAYELHQMLVDGALVPVKIETTTSDNTHLTLLETDLLPQDGTRPEMPDSNSDEATPETKTQAT